MAVMAVRVKGYFITYYFLLLPISNKKGI